MMISECASRKVLEAIATSIDWTRAGAEAYVSRCSSVTKSAQARATSLSVVPRLCYSGQGTIDRLRDRSC